MYAKAAPVATRRWPFQRSRTKSILNVRLYVTTTFKGTSCPRLHVRTCSLTHWIRFPFPWLVLQVFCSWEWRWGLGPTLRFRYSTLDLFSVYLQELQSILLPPGSLLIAASLLWFYVPSMEIMSNYTTNIIDTCLLKAYPPIEFAVHGLILRLRHSIS